MKDGVVDRDGRIRENDKLIAEMKEIIMKWTQPIQQIFKSLRRVPRKILFLIAAAVILIVIIIIAAIPARINIATVEVIRGEFIIDLQARGEIDALNSTNVSLPRMRRRQSSLKIIDMAEEGSIVQKGDFLVQLDNSEALQNVDQAEDNLANALAQLESEKATIASNMAQLESELESQGYNYQQAELSLKMMQFEAEAKKQEYELNMKKAEVALKQARQRIESQKIIDRATLMRAELNVRQAEAELEEAKRALESLTLRAPIGGLVVYKEIFSNTGMKKVQIGDSPWPGMPIIGIPDLSVMQARTTVNEVDISRIENGQNVIVTVDALENRPYYGKITRVAALARREQSTNIKVFDVEVTLDSTDGELRPGMTCGVRIITGRIQDALYVPIQAVFQREGATVVYVMGRNGYRMQEVIVGAKSSDTIVIREGLEEGDRVCLRDPTIPLETIGAEGESTVQPQSRTKRTGSSRSNEVRVIMR
ncbi:MAG TPA: efflux RND transporter periplasmic adaptor subunit [bacterium]|nr:efflux RND transporter periplasmic adaptor subunit [bacterium]